MPIISCTIYKLSEHCLNDNLGRNNGTVVPVHMFTVVFSYELNFLITPTPNVNISAIVKSLDFVGYFNNLTSLNHLKALLEM